MKDNIMLINTSRGALINTTDIIEAKVVKLVI
jgi:lactate dehydrogenase-like 2-hydroxyacid dehydrogenase